MRHCVVCGANITTSDRCVECYAKQTVDIHNELCGEYKNMKIKYYIEERERKVEITIDDFIDGLLYNDLDDRIWLCKIIKDGFDGYYNYSVADILEILYDQGAKDIQYRVLNGIWVNYGSDEEREGISND
jgi:hypothetical protein